MRVLFARATEMFRIEPGETEILRNELRVLTGDDERGRVPALGERVSERGQLDCFRSGADDQSYVSSIQPSP